MKILSFDSTAKVASVALTEDTRLLAAFTVDNGLTQSELLLPMIENVLSVMKLSYSDIDAIATSVGPGSFTGVRIGAALAKGIAFGRNMPCAEVSTLEAIAENLYPLQGILISAMDARRGQVYTATFTSSDEGNVRLTEDRAISTDELALEMKEFTGRNIYVAGDGADAVKAAFLKHGVAFSSTPPLLINENAYSVARVAYRKIQNGDYTTDKALSPTYLRLPQAERERLMKEKEKENKQGDLQ